MFRQVADLIVKWQINNKYLEEKQRDVICYAYEVMIMQSVNFLIAIFIGICFHQLTEVLIFLISYIPLRSFAGGYHAEKDWICMIESAGIIFLVCFLSGNLSGAWNKGVVAGETFAVMSFLSLVPVGASNKPLSIREQIRCRKKFFRLLGSEALWMVLFVVFGHFQLCRCILLGHMTLAVLLVIGRTERKRRN